MSVSFKQSTLSLCWVPGWGGVLEKTKDSLLDRVQCVRTRMATESISAFWGTGRVGCEGAHQRKMNTYDLN